MPSRSLACLLAAGVLTLALVALVPSRAAPAPGATAALAAARLDAAKAAFATFQAAAGAGASPSEAVYTWSVRWLTAEVEAGARAPAALQDHLKRMTDLEAAMTKRFQAGAVSKTDVVACAYYRAEAEVWAARKKLR